MLRRLLLKPRAVREHWIGPRMLTLLVAICAVYVFISASGKHVTLTMFCEKGPLVSVDACLQDNSAASPVTVSGWSYSYAHGVMSSSLCDQISLNPAEITVPIEHQQQPERLLKTDCNGLYMDASHFCYASQRMTPDGSTRFATIFITNANCGDSRFFRGSKAMLIHGRPQRVTDWKQPFAAILDINK